MAEVNWSRAEVEAILKDYFDMFALETQGLPFNKAEHNRQIRLFLNGRSKGSVEFKYENISAVLVKLGLPYIRGYKPARNFQNLLEVSVVEFLESHPSLEAMFRAFAETTVPIPDSLNFSKLNVPPPARDAATIKEPEIEFWNPVKLNYLELEQANKVIGASGEQIAFDYKRWRLIHEGKESFADRIEWVAKTQGDGLGFDILSKNSNGTDRFIEVKSTKLTKEAPIYFSRHEFEFSRRHPENYYLYRIFNLRNDPKLFIVNGSFNDFCTYEPIKFKGYF